MCPSKHNSIDLITRAGDLKALADRLKHLDKLAVDTESNSLYAYRERVCLIQFSSEENDYLVDPLALQDLSILVPIFADPEIEKVFHAAEYDLICLRRDFGFEVNNLFDTMLAARILGRSEIGLGSLLDAEFDVKLEKRYQRANWGQRPLPAHLLEYARLDTHYLIQLRNRLAKELLERKLVPLAEEDFRRMALTSVNGNGVVANADRPVDCWRISGSHDLSPRQAAVLQELCQYRDAVARDLDRPLFKVMNDETLLAISHQLPEDLDQLRRLPGMSAGQLRRHGEQLLECIRRGMKAPLAHPPRTKAPDPRFSERLESLRNWRKEAARKMGVPSDVVLPRDLMQELAYENPRSLQELGQVLGTVPWRLEHFGDQIIKILSRY